MLVLKAQTMKTNWQLMLLIKMAIISWACLAVVYFSGSLKVSVPLEYFM